MISAEAVIARTLSLGAIESRLRPSASSDAELAAVPQVHVPLPDLSCFNLLMGDPVSRDDCRAAAFTSRGEDPSPEYPATVFFT